MPVIATAEDARVNRRRGSAADGVTFWHTLYIGTTRYNMAPGAPDPDQDALFPMAFLVEQDPGSTANAHYHQQDQFQVIVGGHGTMGTHEARPVTVHFAAAHTAYGPIRASNDEGVHYFTLRNGFDPGAKFMTLPENRAALRAVPGRRHRENVTGPLASETGAIIGPEPDGMGAWRYRAVPGERLIGPDPAWGRGQYWVVIDGAMTRDGQTIPRLSCVFVYPEDPPFNAFAGPDGADVLAMQFPLRS
jgi:hypothetical protein